MLVRAITIPMLPAKFYAFTGNAYYFFNFLWKYLIPPISTTQANAHTTWLKTRNVLAYLGSCKFHRINGLPVCRYNFTAFLVRLSRCMMVIYNKVSLVSQFKSLLQQLLNNLCVNPHRIHHHHQPQGLNQEWSVPVSNRQYYSWSLQRFLGRPIPCLLYTSRCV